MPLLDNLPARNSERQSSRQSSDLDRQTTPTDTRV